MSRSGDTFSVSADPINPGEFLACCGLLELADRLWGSAEGWWREGRFHLATAGTLRELLQALVEQPAEEILLIDGAVPAKALIAPLRLRFGQAAAPTVLDAWMTLRLDRGEAVAVGNVPWNFWSGQQTSLRCWTPLRAALIAQLARIPDLAAEHLFSARVPLSGRFGFDAGAAWNALDVGFSPNEQKMDVASSPAVELLAAIGLQRCRPLVSRDRETFTYATWETPLPTIAVAMAATPMFPFAAARYRGRIVSRGQYAALGHSTVLKGYKS